MIRRREGLKATIKNRRRSKSFVTDNAAGSSVGRHAVGEVDRPKDKEADAWCKPNNVTSSILLDSTVSTASMSMSMSFDTSFNSDNTEIRSPVMASPAAAGCSTPIVKKRVRFGGSLNDSAHSPMGEDMLNKNQTSPKMLAESFEWTSSLAPEINLTPIKDDPTAENDWYPFGEDSDDEFSAIEFPAIKIHFDEDEVGEMQDKVGALASPVGVNDMNSFTLNGTKTSRSSSVNTSSAKQDMLLKLREENERLKNELREASEEAGTLDAAGALVDESSRVDTADESTFFENSLLDTSFYERAAHADIGNEDILDEGASQGDWVDVTLDSDLGSDTMESAIKITHNAMDVSPSSSTLRKALRHQRKKASVTSFCPSVYEELKGTYEDVSNSFNQVLCAFFVSLDDVDKTVDAMSAVKKDLRVSHTDKFVPHELKS